MSPSPYVPRAVSELPWSVDHDPNSYITLLDRHGRDIINLGEPATAPSLAYIARSSVGYRDACELLELFVRVAEAGMCADDLPNDFCNADIDTARAFLATARAAALEVK